MSKYTALDAKIMQSIARGKNLFHVISPACRDLSYAMADGTGIEPWRFVDRRLQALRKAGRIVFIRGEWALKQKVEI